MWTNKCPVKCKPMCISETNSCNFLCSSYHTKICLSPKYCLFTPGLRSRWLFRLTPTPTLRSRLRLRLRLRQRLPPNQFVYLNPRPGRGTYYAPSCFSTITQKRRRAAPLNFRVPSYNSMTHIVWNFWPEVTKGQVTRSRQSSEVHE